MGDFKPEIHTRYFSIHGVFFFLSAFAVGLEPVPEDVDAPSLISIAISPGISDLNFLFIFVISELDIWQNSPPKEMSLFWQSIWHIYFLAILKEKTILRDSTIVGSFKPWAMSDKDSDDSMEILERLFKLKNE